MNGTLLPGLNTSPPVRAQVSAFRDGTDARGPAGDPLGTGPSGSATYLRLPPHSPSGRLREAPALGFLSCVTDVAPPWGQHHVLPPISRKQWKTKEPIHVGPNLSPPSSLHSCLPRFHATTPAVPKVTSELLWVTGEGEMVPSLWLWAWSSACWLRLTRAPRIPPLLASSLLPGCSSAGFFLAPRLPRGPRAASGL